MTRPYGVTVPAWRAMTCLSALVAAAVSVAGCTEHHRSRPRPETVLVEQYVSALPVGTAVHLCLERLPCRVTRVRAEGRANPPQLSTLPLPSGVSAQEANGWRLRGYASARGVTYRGTTRLIYHLAVDPPCKCAGDYAYLRLRPAAGSH